MKRLGLMLVAALAVSTSQVRAAETCITQSQMKEPERAALAAAASAMATKIQANDAAGVKAATIAQFQNDFSGMANEIASTAPKLSGAAAQVEEIYILDASTLAKTAAGANPDAQFYCTLNQSVNGAQFAIPQLPPAKYAFAMVRMESATPWRLSLLLQEQGGQWLLAGLYPKELTAGGHDGLWYWTQARALAAAKDQWTAWLYYQEAQSLLTPAAFVVSTHLDKLQAETSSTMPSAISGGIGTDVPLVVKAADGTEFRFTAFMVDDSLHADKVDLAAHIKVETVGNSSAARQRNMDAMKALLAAHPELRKSFHGMWVFADAPGESPFATEVAMAEIK